MVFAIWDVRAERYLPPFQFLTKGEAIRAFMNLVADKRSVVGMNPEDYKLVSLAEFDEKSGLFNNQEAVTLAWASDFVKAEVAPLRKV